MTRRHAIPPGAREGYVFPLALTAIALIGLILAAAATRVRSSSELVAALGDRGRERAAMISAESELVYALLTQPMGVRGMAVGGQEVMAGLGFAVEGGSLVPVNGTPFRMSVPGDDVVVRIYATEGLASIDYPERAVLQALLDSDRPLTAQADKLIASLDDYRDPDNLRRVGGGEAPDYPEGRQPANAPLRSNLEACSALGWEDTPLCANALELALLTATGSDEALNVVVAGEPILSELLPERDVARAMERIASGEVTSFGALGLSALDATDDPFALATAPGPEFVLVTQAANGRYIRRSHLILTQQDQVSPYAFRPFFEFGGENGAALLGVDNVEDLPDFPRPGP